MEYSEYTSDTWNKMYRMYRGKFMNWLAKKGISYDDASDLYQESFIVLYENLVKGELSSGDEKLLKAFLFSVGQNKLYTKFREGKKKIKLIESFPGVDDNTDEDPESISNHRQQRIKEEIQKMKDPCKSILLLFYYEKKKMKQIAEIMNYSSNPKVQKWRCLVYLKEAILFN